MVLSELTSEERAAANQTSQLIRATLEGIVFDGESWLERFNAWNDDEHNRLVGLLYNIDPYNLEIAGDNMAFDYMDADCPLLANIISMALFTCISFKEHEKNTIAKVFSEKNPDTRVQIINEYFKFIDSSMKNTGINKVIVLMNDEAERQSVFYSRYRYYDSYVHFDALREVLRGETVESIYLQYTLWRLTQDKQSLKKLVSQIKNYLKTYYYAFEDPELDFSRLLEGLPISRKLEIITRWMELIGFYTKGIFEEYQKREWLSASDQIMDAYHTPNQISRFALLNCKSKNRDDDDKTVLQKAICGSSYIIWVKTADIYTILCDLFRILYGKSEQDLKRMSLSKKTVLAQFDTLCKVRNNYISFIFRHSAFYEASREKFSLSGLKAEEESAKIITSSIDDLLDVTSSIVDDDIAGLMSAKQRYLSRISSYLAVDYRAQLGQYMDQVAAKMKEKLSKLAAFDTIFSSVSDDFLPFASLWVRHKEILYSLVSAEYLYGEYIKGHEEIDRFDYSCVSILYYMALEDFANKLLYIPYMNDVLIPNAEDVIRKKAPGYVTDSKYYVGNWKLCQFKGTLEIGPMGYLLEGIDRLPKLEEYLKIKYPNINTTSVKRFGTSLLSIKDRRNEAAHGGNLIRYSDAKEDKENVYFSNEAEEIRGLIKALLEMLT